MAASDFKMETSSALSTLPQRIFVIAPTTDKLSPRFIYVFIEVDIKCYGQYFKRDWHCLEMIPTFPSHVTPLCSLNQVRKKYKGTKICHRSRGIKYLFRIVGRGRKVRATLGPPTGSDFPPRHIRRQGWQSGGGRGRRGIQRRRRLRPRGDGRGVRSVLLPPLLFGRSPAATDDVFADRFQMQADDRTPSLVADVVVRPADRSKTIVHRRGGGWWIRRDGARDRRVSVLVHHHRAVPTLASDDIFSLNGHGHSNIKELTRPCSTQNEHAAASGDRIELTDGGKAASNTTAVTVGATWARGVRCSSRGNARDYTDDVPSTRASWPCFVFDVVCFRLAIRRTRGDRRKWLIYF